MVRNFMRPAASLAVVCGALAGFAAWAPGGAQTVLGIEVLSSRPELVSGGDALVRISGAAGAPQVTVDASDVRGPAILKVAERRIFGIPKSAKT